LISRFPAFAKLRPCECSRSADLQTSQHEYPLGILCPLALRPTPHLSLPHQDPSAVIGKNISLLVQDLLNRKYRKVALDPVLDLTAPRPYASSVIMAKTHYPVDAEQAMDELCRVDRRLGRLIRKVGSFPTKKPKPQPPFESLLRAIVYQQLAGAAAATIYGRVKALGSDGNCPTPEEILRATKAKLRLAGLSRQKIAAVKDLARKTIDGTVPTLAVIRRMSEEEILERLTKVRGIGEWSVQMFLMFRLGRPDVLPIRDYGIQKGFQHVYRLADTPKPQAILEHGERWRPYRSIASWYLWRAVEQKNAQKKAAKKSRRK
jgi:DNA-3-methyladenine glycosylase II